MEKFLGSGNALPMWVADMDFLTPNYITEALVERAKHGVFGYAYREDGFYTSLIDWLKRRHQWSVERDWIVFSPGVVPAVNLCVLAMTEVGGKIVVQPPVYFPFFTAVKDHGRELVYNPLIEKDGRLCMDMDNLESLAKQGAKMLILCSPHNPGGSVWTRSELEEMAKICLRYNMIILSDEIHCDLVYAPHKHIPVASLSKEIGMQTITTVAPSKTFNLSGLATSAVVIENDSMRRRFVATLEHLHIGGGNVFGNLASEMAYTHGDEYVDSLMKYLAGNVDELERYAEEHLPLIKVFRPEATFLVWLDCWEMRMEDKALNEFFLYRAKVGLNPGAMFGPGGEGFMRMNIGCPKSTLIEGLDRIRIALEG